MMKLIQAIRQRLFPSQQPDEPTTESNTERQLSASVTENINSGGGAVIQGGVNTTGGNFTGRDSYTIQLPKPDPSAATAPSPPTDFVGRTAELAQLTKLLISGHSAAITALQGMGGIGKTVLAQKLAEQLNQQQPVHFSGGIFWASLEDHSSSAEPILREWAEYCGIELPQALNPNELPGRVRSALTLRQQNEGRLMAVLDDVRPEWEANAHLLRQSLPTGTPLLITTREQYLADSLKAEVLSLDLLPTTDGATFLANIIQQPDLLQDEALVNQLLERLGHLPLAIRLAATYIRNFSTKPGFTLAQFVDQLEIQALKPLETQGAERGLIATFAISYDALTPQQQHLFGLASIYSPPLLTLENIAGLVESAYDLDQATLEAEFDWLVNMALLEWHEEISGRYTLHPLLSQYAYGRLQERVDDAQAIHAQAAGLLHDRVRQGEGMPEEQLAEVDQWEMAGMWEQMARRAGALVGRLDRLGYWPEIDERLARALECLTDFTDEDRRKWRSYLMHSRGIIAKAGAEWDKAITYYQQSLQTFEQVGDSHGRAATYNNLGLVYQAKGEWDKAITYYQQSLQTFEQVGDSHGMATTYNNLGEVYRVKGEWDKAITYYQQSLQTLEQVGDSHGIAQTYNNLGAVYADKGEWDKAITYYEQSLATKEQVGDSHGIAQTYNNLGAVYQAKGEWDKAITYYEQSLATKEQVGDSHGMASTYNNLGLVYADKGEWDKAIGYYEQSLQTFEQVGDSHGMATTYNNLGNVYQAKGEWDKAITYYQQSLQTFEQVGDSHGMASTYNNLGEVYRVKGEWDKAITYYQQSLQTKEQVGDSHGRAATYNNLGNVYQAKGEWDKAITYYQQSLQTFEQVGDSHRRAATYNNLGAVYQAKGEWDKAITYYQQSLAIDEQVGDSHGMASTRTNIGILLLEQSQPMEAQELFARAFFVFEQMGAPEMETAWAGLVSACGSEENAKAYLAEVVAGESL